METQKIIGATKNQWLYKAVIKLPVLILEAVKEMKQPWPTIVGKYLCYFDSTKNQICILSLYDLA